MAHANPKILAHKTSRYSQRAILVDSIGKIAEWLPIQKINIRRSQDHHKNHTQNHQGDH